MTDERMAALVNAFRTIDRLHNLGDAIYSVRERVDCSDLPENVSSWEHPDVVAYGAAVKCAREIVAGFDDTPAQEPERCDGPEADIVPSDCDEGCDECCGEGWIMDDDGRPVPCSGMADEDTEHPAQEPEPCGSRKICTGCGHDDGDHSASAFGTMCLVPGCECDGKAPVAPAPAPTQEDGCSEQSGTGYEDTNAVPSPRECTPTSGIAPAERRGSSSTEPAREADLDVLDVIQHALDHNDGDDHNKFVALRRSFYAIRHLRARLDRETRRADEFEKRIAREATLRGEAVRECKDLRARLAAAERRVEELTRVVGESHYLTAYLLRHLASISKADIRFRLVEIDNALDAALAKKGEGA